MADKPLMNRTLQVVSPFEVRLADVPVPPLRPDDVLVSIAAVGICGTDLEIYDGNLPYLKMGTAHYPIIPGHEWSGEIVGVGEAVAKFRSGDLVVGECHQGCGNCEYCRRGAYNQCPDRVRLGIQGRDGAVARYVVTDQRTLHLIPEGISLKEAALVEPATVAFHAVDKVSSFLGKRVVLLGCGPIGLLTLQMARALGASSIVAVDLLPNRLDLAKELGADEGVRVERKTALADVRAASGRLGFDVVLEATGDPEMVDPALDMAGLGGEVVLLSLYGGKTSSIRGDVIVTRELKVYGTLASPGVWDRTIGLIRARQLRVEPLISHTFPLDEAGRALSIAHEKADGAIKVLIAPAS